MFNLKRKIRQVVQQIAESFQEPKDPNILVAEIHNDFDTATERILKEAKEVLAEKEDINKGERLLKLGFNKSLSAKEAENIVYKRRKSRELAEAIEHCQVFYPKYKFITLGEVERICKKYGLVFGEASRYIGDVPEKNVKEIESFLFREEDKIRHEIVEWTHTSSMGVVYSEGRGFCRINPISGYSDEVYITDKNVTEFLDRQPFVICASLKDFDMRKKEIVDGYKVCDIPDHIVLQPLKGGFLIISKWGLEGQDSALVNEKQN